MSSKITNNHAKTVLITGATRGVGYETAKLLHSLGYTVIGTSRFPEKIPQKDRIEGISYLPMDLSDEKSIAELANFTGEIDILINSAGSSQVGAIEDVPTENVHKYFEINVLGQIQVIQQFLPQMRKRQSGIIINISSMAGVTPVPYSSFYGAAKSAIRAISQGLRHEMKDFGITVVDIAPFEVNTTIPQELFLSKDSPYYINASYQKQVRDKNLKEAIMPDAVAQLILKVIQMKNPKGFYPIGKKARFKTWLLKHLPQSAVEKFMQNRYLP